MTREEAFELLKKYNSDPFHIRHAITVEAVMKWFAKDQGYGDEADHWGLVGLLHDIDFELYPDQHCIKAPELLRAGGVPEDIIHGVVSHGYGITVDVKPEHQMENAPLKEHKGHGTEISQEEIQEQGLRGGLLARSHCQGSGDAGLGPERAAAEDPDRNAGLRG